MNCPCPVFLSSSIFAQNAIGQAGSVVDDHDFVFRDLVRGDRRSRQRRYFERQFRRRSEGLAQIHTLLWLACIDDEHVQFFPPLDGKQKIVIDLQRIVGFDADSAFRKPEHEIEAGEFRQRGGIGGNGDLLARDLFIVQTETETGTSTGLSLP